MGYYKDRAIDIAEFVDELVSYKRSRSYVHYALKRRYSNDQEVEYGMDVFDEKKGESNE